MTIDQITLGVLWVRRVDLTEQDVQGDSSISGIEEVVVYPRKYEALFLDQAGLVTVQPRELLGGILDGLHLNGRESVADNMADCREDVEIHPIRANFVRKAIEKTIGGMSFLE